MFGVPETWQPGQIAEFEEYWNGLLAGNLSERRRARFIPGGVKPFDTKEHALKDDYDDWLARLVCYAFSVSPHPFVRDNTRATAATSHTSALAEGLLPVAEWVRSLMNRLLATVFNAPGLQFVWDSDSANAAEQAQIDVAYVGAGILTADEVRDRLGLPTLANTTRAGGGKPAAKPLFSTLPQGGKTQAVAGVEALDKANDCHDEAGRFCGPGDATSGANTQETMNTKNPTIPYVSPKTPEQILGDANNSWLAGPNVSPENRHECVALLHWAIPDLPLASEWVKGDAITPENAKSLPAGTALAIFGEGSKYGEHAAILDKPGRDDKRGDGIYVVEQGSRERTQRAFYSFTVPNSRGRTANDFSVIASNKRH